MPRELTLLDALVPTLFVMFILSVILHSILETLFGRLGLYRHVWHPPLFRISIFACIFGVLGLLVML